MRHGMSPLNSLKSKELPLSISDTLSHIPHSSVSNIGFSHFSVSGVRNTGQLVVRFILNGTVSIKANCL